MARGGVLDPHPEPPFSTPSVGSPWSLLGLMIAEVVGMKGGMERGEVHCRHCWGTARHRGGGQGCERVGRRGAANGEERVFPQGPVIDSVGSWLEIIGLIDDLDRAQSR